MKKLRKALGLSQQQLAEYFRVSRGFVAQIETGRRELPFSFVPKITALVKWLAEEAPLVETKPLASPELGQQLLQKEQHLEHQLYLRKRQLEKLQQLHHQHQRCLSLCQAVKELDEKSRLWAEMQEAEINMQQGTVNEIEIYWLSHRVKLLELELEWIQRESKRVSI